MQRTGAALAVWWLRLCTHSARGPGLILSQGTRFHMLQLRGLHAATKERFSKISYAAQSNIYTYIYIYTGNRLVVARGRVGVSKVCKEGQKRHTPSYKINKSWRYNVQCCNYSQ